MIAWKKIPIFAGLEAEALELLTSKAECATFIAGAVIMREGESGNRMYVIRSGAVKVWKGKGDGSRVELARLGSGEFFGEMCILETLPRAATIEAASETTLDSLSPGAFYELYEAMPEQYSILILNIARDLSRRLRRIDEIFAARC